MFNIKIIKFLKKRSTISLFLMLIMVFTLYLLLLVSVGYFNFLNFFLPKGVESLFLDLVKRRINVVYSIIGSLFGGSVCSFRGIYTYKDQWDEKLAICYYLGPIATIILGIISYCLFTESFLTIKIGEKELYSTATSSLAIGFLVGFSWRNLIDKVIELGSVLFGKPS